MNREVKFIASGLAICVAVLIAFVVWLTKEESKPTRSETYEWIPNSPTPTVTPPLTIVGFSLTPTVTPQKATETPIPTEVVNTPTPTPEPTSTPVPVTKGVVGEKWCEENGTHYWKPWAWYTAITVVNSPQYRLQLIAKTNEAGVRIAYDPCGEWRYCVALPVYWAGGTSKDIGRCVDIYMANGSVLKCVLGDTKKVEHSLEGKGMYGRCGEVIEVQCDGNKLPSLVKQMGDASYLGDEWKGEVRKIVVLDMFIGGVQQ